MKPIKTAADYVAIAVAPVLIFLMISSLANFFTLTLYRGGFTVRLSWILVMFTMGTVGIARIAIERDRGYSLGYAGILGLVTFVSMLRFVDSPIFALLILGLIAYLSDVIVRDCTLIDDEVDASGQGLIDSGRLFVKEQIGNQNPGEPDAPAEESEGRTDKTHQPGRTVLYLALAALPLFGLGQFFLRNDSATWDRAQRLLAFYLFASLSLLVTTSFLGLRRYLRQRRVDMPADVSIAWLAGGVAMIATVLLIAYMAPMPGRALATFDLPFQMDSPGNTRASRFGWGNEGADQSNPDAPKTIDPHKGKQEDGQVAQQGAPEGNVSEGGRDKGPAGNQSGGKQSGGSSSQQSSGPEDQSAQSKSSPSESGQSQSGQKQSEQQSQEKQSSSGDSQQRKQSDTQQDSNESRAADDSDADSEGSGESPEQDEPEQDEPEQGEHSGSSQQSSMPPERDSPQDSPSPSAAQSVANGIGMLASLIKFLVFVALAGVVIAYVWIHREMIRQWWESLMGWGRDPELPAQDEFLDLITQVPPREFASFRNPIGQESDSRRVMVITFQAFEAWSREHGAPRGRDETPTEFLRRASKVAPQVSQPASQIVDSYNRIVYGRGRPTERDLQAAAQVWQLMQRR